MKKITQNWKGKKKYVASLLFVVLLAYGITGCSSDKTTTATTPDATTTAVADTTATTDTATAATDTTATTDTTTATDATVATDTTTTTDATTKTFTLDELATYDGQNGNPAYVAVDGIVYDVSNVPQWKSGQHQGYAAGVDLTDAIAAAPHGTSVLTDLVQVGVLQK